MSYNYKQMAKRWNNDTLSKSYILSLEQLNNKLKYGNRREILKAKRNNRKLAKAIKYQNDINYKNVLRNNYKYRNK